MSEIKSYHAHVYFNAATMVQAQTLWAAASAMLTPSMLRLSYFFGFHSSANCCASAICVEDI